ncbi:WRKY domain containing protein [Trema orientale]|uniref:WRKY domain containing protein n=1 Tax=Trema orientale TaxID=63057 RepID=A0A2P5FQA1_TREOI|nr:WRKY domain containing protein [Trema orientale]
MSKAHSAPSSPPSPPSSPTFDGSSTIESLPKLPPEFVYHLPPPLVTDYLNQEVNEVFDLRHPKRLRNEPSIILDQEAELLHPQPLPPPPLPPQHAQPPSPPRNHPTSPHNIHPLEESTSSQELSLDHQPQTRLHLVDVQEVINLNQVVQPQPNLPVVDLQDVINVDQEVEPQPNLPVVNIQEAINIDQEVLPQPNLPVVNVQGVINIDQEVEPQPNLPVVHIQEAINLDQEVQPQPNLPVMNVQEINLDHMPPPQLPDEVVYNLPLPDVNWQRWSSTGRAVLNRTMQVRFYFRCVVPNCRARLHIDKDAMTNTVVRRGSKYEHNH